MPKDAAKQRRRRTFSNLARVSYGGREGAPELGFLSGVCPLNCLCTPPKYLRGCLALLPRYEVLDEPRRAGLDPDSPRSEAQQLKEGASSSSKKVPLNPPPNPFPSRVLAQTGPAVIASVRSSTGHTCTANIRLPNAASYGQGAAGQGCRGPFFRNPGTPRARSGPTCLQELGHLASGIVGKPVPRAHGLRLASALLLTVGTRRSYVRSFRNWVLGPEGPTLARSRPSPPHTHTYAQRVAPKVFNLYR